MMNIDELTIKLRADFNNKIRGLYIKDSCERCGNTKGLELHHHTKFFSDIIKDVLKKTGFKNKKEFTKEEFQMIKSMVAYEQLKESMYLTLCNKCHDEIHSELSAGGKKIKHIKTTEKSKDVTTNYCIMQLANKCAKKEGELPTKDFYMATSTFYKNGKINMCKHCLKEYVYESNGEISIDKLKQVLRMNDIPFFEKEWESALNDEKETIGVYMKNVFLNHKGEGWINGDNI